MENCTLMAAARKIEYSWPLLDIRLVKLFLAIPSEENYFRGMGCYLHRRAIDGSVPEMVAWKQGKSMGTVNIDGHAIAAGELLDLSGLHPGIKDYVDTVKLEAQLQCMKDLKNTENADNRKFSILRNIQAVRHIDDWMKYMDARS
jgi:asparagine synthase (glutamine-hydrolysing)